MALQVLVKAMRPRGNYRARWSARAWEPDGLIRPVPETPADRPLLTWLRDEPVRVPRRFDTIRRAAHHERWLRALRYGYKSDVLWCVLSEERQAGAGATPG